MKKTIGGENHFAANRFLCTGNQPGRQMSKIQKKERPPGDR
jgi:hypothetical protein